MAEFLPVTHTEAEWKLVPESYVHLIKNGVVIHKKPAAFLDRTKQEKKYKQVFDEDTGMQKVVETVKTIKRAPAASLKQYKKDGYQRCNRTGSEILNWDGSAIPKQKDSK